MQVAILCGGLGSRIRESGELIPKPMLPIGGKPILWHIMKGYASCGLKDFVLCLGYKGMVIRDFFVNFRTNVSDCTLSLGGPREIVFHTEFDESDWRVTLADTGESTMTGGRLWRIRHYLEGDHFCLTYGDGVADINIQSLIEQHKKSGLVATVTAVRAVGRFGEIDVDPSGRVRVFNEKPPATSGRISGGFFVFDNRRIWDFLDDRADLTFEREPLENLARAGQLGVYDHDGYWQCMDTPREHALLNDLWNRGQAPWKVWR